MNFHKVQATQGDLRAPPEKLAYSINEAADATSLSRASIYNLIAQKRLRTMKYGVKTLIPADSLRGFLASLEQEAA